ncbi:hypothetical protein J2755_000937 [Methanohalophilus levihalophilus]|uniref:DUF2953 domain-containing protein n=1 Tax=Methanohalophilus levihalophilus TaxID=1431282 RepID=UPI001AE5515B|nr:DUF2953 domain-containing protein [Methanohalophilus levihalophilus]MBP2030003.1 hypothetical protein [Methanohalophilus levihalophilus]
MDWILYLLLALIVLPLLLLFFPVKIHLKARVGTEALEHSIRINWLGITVNPERFSRSDKGKKKEKKESEPKKAESKKNKKKEETTKKKGKGKSSFSIKQIPIFLNPVRQLLFDLWKAVDFPLMKINAAFGFDDPANTGMACGFMYGAAGVVNHHIPSFKYNVSPVFDDRKLDFSVSSTIRIKLYRIVFAALHVLYSKDGRRAIWAAWKMRSN